MKKVRKFWSTAVKYINDDQMQILPGELAFFMILSFFSIIPLIGIITSSFVSIDSINRIQNDIPNAIYQILISLIDIKSSGNILIFIIVALYFSSDAASALIITSNYIYKIPNSSFFKRKIKAVVMTILLIILIVFLTIGMAFGDTIINFIRENYSSDFIEYLKVIYNYLKIPISFVLIFIIVKTLYTIAPDERISSTYNNYGTLFTTICWIITTRLYSWYLSVNNTYNIFYGSFANIMILFFWIYFLSFILTIGMAINYADYNNRQNLSTKS